MELVTQTNWYVITGGPSSGKTTTINMLNSLGYRTTVEHARHYIDTQRLSGLSVNDIRDNQKEFQAGVLNMQIEQEKSIPTNEVVFLDRAIPDALAYYHFLNLDLDPLITNAIKLVNYRKIFIMDYLPLINDYARTEDVESQKKIHELIVEVYKSLSFQIIHIPVFPVEMRVEIILKNL